jgi:hypothetical protein
LKELGGRIQNIDVMSTFFVFYISYGYFKTARKAPKDWKYKEEFDKMMCGILFCMQLI